MNTDKGVSGSRVVLAMFCFAGMVTGVLWYYTYLHRKPFIPLRISLAEVFGRERTIRVEGGRDKQGPVTLRIVMNIDFDPQSDREKIASMRKQVLELAGENLDLTEYEIFEFNLVYLVPESEPLRYQSSLALEKGVPDETSLKEDYEGSES